MVRKTLYLLVAAANLLLAACVKDTLEAPAIGIDDSNEMPVEFLFDAPESDTRAMTVPTRTKFEDGDVIHVIANFEHENNRKGKYSSQRYGAMIYDGEKWTAMAEATLRWPYDAVSGDFVAYFVPISSDTGSASGAHEGPLTEVSNSTSSDGGDETDADAWMNDSDSHWINFSWLNETTRVLQAGENSTYTRSQYLDPLHAVSEQNIEYGHAVRMRFKHVLTHVSFLNLTPATSFSTYRLLLTEANDTPSTTQQLPTQYRLVLKRDANDKLSLGIYYRKTDEPYISTKPLKNQYDIFSSDQNTKVDYANFYLPPTFVSDGEIDDDNKSIDYANLALQSEFDHTYLTFHYKGESASDETPGEEETQSPDEAASTSTMYFEKGRPYYIDVKRDKGIVITPDDSMGWEEPQGVFEVNVPHFLYAATTPGVDYIYEDEDTHVKTPILTWNPSQSVVTLQVDVCFGYFDDYSYGNCGGGFYPAWGNTEQGSGDQVWWNGSDIGANYTDAEHIFHVDLDQSVIFDGNNHSICHVAHPIFRNVFGGIRNLAIRHADVYAESRRLNKAGRESAELYQGILCQALYDSGTIDRVLLDNAHLTVWVDNTMYDPETEGQRDSHSLGLLVGFASTSADETTDISNIFLRGDNQIRVLPYQAATGETPETREDGVEAGSASQPYVDLVVGGLVGQCTSTTIDNISWLYSTPELGNDHKVSEDTCKKGHKHDSDHALAKQNALRVNVETGTMLSSDGSLFVGGLLGQSAGNLSNVLDLDNVTVDASASTFNTAYTGGLIARQASYSNTSDKSIENCSLKCIVKAPAISSTTGAASRTGGLVGLILGTDAKNITLICDVTGSKSDNNRPEFTGGADDPIFTVGGVFGEISQSAGVCHDFSGITAMGYTTTAIDGANSTISKKDNKLAIGQFVGVASKIYDPTGSSTEGDDGKTQEKWDSWMKNILIQITGLSLSQDEDTLCGWFE